VYDTPRVRKPPHKKSRLTQLHVRRWLEDNTHPLPDQHPVRVFFADQPSYRKIYLEYRHANPKGTRHYLCWETFRKWWKKRWPWFKKQRRTKAACNVCCVFWIELDSFHKWKGATVDLQTPESLERISEFGALKQEWEQHKAQARCEYNFYLEKKSQSEEGKLPKTLNLSMDAKTLVQLPQFAVVQPKMSYFKRRMAVTPMGILDEQSGNGVTYFYDSRCGKTSANHVISTLDKHLNSLDLRCFDDLYMTFDNCAVNKNRWVLTYFFYLVASGAFELVQWSFPIAGHTKFGPDTMFGWLGPHLDQYDLFEVQDLANHANEHGTPVRYSGQVLAHADLKLWSAQLEPLVKSVDHITAMHQFRITKDSAAIFLETKEYSSSPEWTRCDIFRCQQLPAVSPAPLPLKPLSAAKLADLAGLEKFVPGKYLSYAHPADPV
jgi:hypothetical protein